jgi:dihydroorotase
MSAEEGSGLRDPQPLDLVVRGGRVVDPAAGLDARLDVGVRNGRVVALEPDLSGSIAPPRSDYPPDLGTSIIDATGAIVAPGFVDLHAHVYSGVCALTVPADETSSVSGVTTVVSAGDAGANTIEGFRRLVVQQSRTRVLAFLHVSSVGLAPWPAGEARDLDLLDVGAGIRAARENADIVVGVKVRMTADQVIGDNDLEPLRRAVRIADAAGLPVMMHIGFCPRPIGELLDLLRPGDIVTHCYTGSANTLLEEGRIAPAAHAARRRGVRFDVGHGFGSFDYRVADAAVVEGFWPDTISTDLHSLSAREIVVDLPTTVGKLLDLGLPLTDAIAAVTSRPAAAIGRSATLGSLVLGRVADLVAFEIESGERRYRDSFGGTRTGTVGIRVRHTVRAGIPWFAPLPHPGRGVAVAAD